MKFIFICLYSIFSLPYTSIFLLRLGLDTNYFLRVAFSSFAFFSSSFFFFFFFLCCTRFTFRGQSTVLHCSCTVYTVHVLFRGPITTLFRKKKFKSGFYGTIHRFKNYFVTVFSVFSCIQINP